MKNIKLIIPVCLFFLLVADLRATDVRLEDYWSYYLNGRRSFRYSAPASGHYKQFGAGYYRSGNITGGRIVNVDDYYNSGSLSLDFWRLNYYMGNVGTILFTRGYAPLTSGYQYSNVYKSGYFRSPNRYGYGCVSLTEYAGYRTWLETSDVDFDNYHRF